MRWAYRWRKELRSGIYYDKLLPGGFLKPEDLEPDVSGFSFYLDAFQELSTSRAVSMAIGAIPFTAIVEYSRIYELSDYEDFAYIIRHLDNTFLELNAEKPADKTVGGKKNASTHTDKKNSNKSGHLR